MENEPNTKKVRVKFSELIGSMDTETSMFVLDWMLRTGKPYERVCGRWDKKGINQFLFDDSANNHDRIVGIPADQQLFFDAVFARAIYKKPSYAGITKWREKERIHPDRWRVFDIPVYTYPKGQVRTRYIWGELGTIQGMKGSVLRSGLPAREDALNGYIVDSDIYTIGRGWVVRFKYSFTDREARYVNYRPLKGARNLQYIELGNSGHPKHPLYLSGALEMKAYGSVFRIVKFE